MSDVKTDVMEIARDRCISDRIDDVTNIVAMEFFTHINGAPDHCFDHGLLVGLLCVDCSDKLTIAQDGDPVRDLKDLFHAMGNIDNRCSLIVQFSNDLEQQFCFFVIQSGGRFIHDDNFRIITDRACNLQQLALRHAQILGQHVGIQFNTNTVK